MMELAQQGWRGIGLRCDGGTIRFEHTAVLVAACETPIVNVLYAEQALPVDRLRRARSGFF